MSFNKEKELKKIKNEVLECKGCSLCESRIYPVIGEGKHSTDIMLVGEAPGLNESKTGRPFCGKAGKVLDELLNSAGIKREDVYITNILKDRPPDNRDPLPQEIEACIPYLKRQIKAINPKVMGCLGRHAMNVLMEEFGIGSAGAISQIHGKVFEADRIKIVPLYHPAVAVYNPNMKEVLKEDFKVLKDL